MFSRSSQFDKYLEKATSQLLLEPDWDSVLQICDSIRQGDVTPKNAVSGIKRKITADNPHVALFALQVLESCVKNCGGVIHQEIATKEMMEFLKDQVKARQDPVKAKILELIQVWSHAFRNEPVYKVVQDTFHLMKMEGYTFPALKEADAMFTAEKAPEWKEGDVCNRCRTKFGTFNRQHHCRNCGEVFCSKCSSKNSIIPKFGIEREVRVCDSCYDSINKPSSKKSEGGEDDLPAEYLASPLSKQSQVPQQKSEQEIQEEEELQLAIALSQSEHENKEKERSRLRKNYGLYSGSTNERPVSPATEPKAPTATVSAPMIDTADMDPELARYLNRNYWQQRSEENKNQAPTTQPSAPVVAAEPKISGGKVLESYQNGESEDDQEQFLRALQSSLEIFVNRMRSNSQRGRSIANDSSVQSLFSVISNMHPQLMKYTQEQEDLRAHYESLQDKLAQLRDAREALNALRDEHREKKRREMEELERQRQIQMAQKLEIMRQKKHEYLEMQRQLALQRLQEQEREMQMRFEQQKHLTQMRQYQNYGYPQVPQQYGHVPQVGGMMPPGPGMMQQGMPPLQQGMPPVQLQAGIPPGASQAFSPGGSLDGSPVHQLHQQPQNYAHQGGMVPAGASNMGVAPGSMAQGPMSQGSMGGAPTQQVSSQQMYSQPGSQPGYSQAGAPYQAMASTLPTASMSGTYQDPNMTGQNYQQQPLQYNPTTSPPNSLPSQGGMVVNPGYTAPPTQNMDYQAFNMQGMASALPTQTQQQMYNAPQQPQYVGGAPAHHPQGHYQQPGVPPPQMAQGGQAAPSQGPPPVQQAEGELISFD
ncbi:hepatocyte growth factor-regulated tyrosine kinase substrate-like isoform X2 [Argopecten irradians]|uniref:hepatocyte growth factor-regulated tyrosine kinase substrate-like isoform X2 n=1 Tax=Argopecten irradians TaxID=31199 RepID=UPI00371878E5